MSLQDLVNVSISSATVTPTRPGFGVPLVAAYHNHYTDRVRFYSNLAGVTGDGFAVTEPGYLAAAIAFSQNPAPTKVAIGRRALAMTQTLTMLMSSTSALDTYTLTIVGWDGVVHKMDFASTGVAATDGASLVTAINAATMSPVVSAGTAPPVVSLTGTPAANEQIVIAITTGGARGTAVFKWSSDGGATYTTGLTANFATGTNYSTNNVYTSNSTMGFASGTSTVTLTQIAGKLVDVQRWNPLGNTTPLIVLTDTTADPGIGTDLTAIDAAAPPGSYYGVGLDSNSSAEVTGAAAFCEAKTLLMLYNNSDTHCITTATDDIFSLQAGLAHARSGGLYSGQGLLTYAGFAWLAKTLPSTPGSLTFMYKTLAGVPADTNLSETAQVNLTAKKANFYLTIAGINITVNGWDAAGEFLDIVWGTDALTAQIQIDVFAALAGSPKISYTDLGVDLLKSLVLADLMLFADNQHQFVALNPTPTVSAPTVASISATTRGSRVFPGITFAAKLAGAIHTLTIQGVLQP